MLCNTCAGTEYGAIFKELGESCITVSGKGNSGTSRTGAACETCLGQGVHLVQIGSCGNCGTSVVVWQPCLTCHGTGQAEKSLESINPRYH